MKAILWFVLSCYIVHSKAMDCGIGKSNKDEIKQAINACIKNNETMEKIWEMTSSSSLSSTGSPTSEKDSNSANDSSEDDDIKSNVKNTKGGRASRIKRAKSLTNSNIPKQTSQAKGRTEEGSKQESDTDNDDDIKMSEEETQSSQDNSEKCVVQCILEHLEMTDDKGLPEHSKFVDVLVKNASGRELRAFLQETTDECFQEMDEENDQDHCEYSTKLVTCLAEKGKSNCADWPAGSLPF